jgi:hypothetical protein
MTFGKSRDSAGLFKSVEWTVNFIWSAGGFDPLELLDGRLRL